MVLEEEVRHRVSGLFLKPLDDVRVDIEREGDRRMAKALGHDFRMHPSLQGQSRIGVPEAVKGNPRQP